MNRNTITVEKTAMARLFAGFGAMPAPDDDDIYHGPGGPRVREIALAIMQRARMQHVMIEAVTGKAPTQKALDAIARQIVADIDDDLCPRPKWPRPKFDGLELAAAAAQFQIAASSDSALQGAFQQGADRLFDAAFATHAQG